MQPLSINDYIPRPLSSSVPFSLSLPLIDSKDELIQDFKRIGIVDENLESYLLDELKSAELNDYELDNLRRVFLRPHKFKLHDRVCEMPLGDFILQLLTDLHLESCKIQIVGSYVWKILGLPFIKRILFKCGFDFERLSERQQAYFEEKISLEPGDIDVRIILEGVEGYDTFDQREALLTEIKTSSEKILGTTPQIAPVKNNPSESNRYVVTGFGDDKFKVEILWVKKFVRDNLCVRDDLKICFSSLFFLGKHTNLPEWKTSERIGKVVFDKLLDLITIRNCENVEGRTLGKILKELVKGSWINDEVMRCNLFRKAYQDCHGNSRELSELIIKSTVSLSKHHQLQMVAMAFKYLHLYLREKKDIFFLESFLQECFPNAFTRQLIKFYLFPTEVSKITLIEVLACEIISSAQGRKGGKILHQCWFMDDAILLVDYDLFKEIKDCLKKYLDTYPDIELNKQIVYKIIVSKLVRKAGWLKCAWYFFRHEVKTSTSKFLVGCALYSINETLQIIKDHDLTHEDTDETTQYLIKFLHQESDKNRETILKISLTLLIEFLVRSTPVDLEKYLELLENSCRFDEILRSLIQKKVVLPQETAMRILKSRQYGSMVLPQVIGFLEKGHQLKVDHPKTLLKEHEGTLLFFRLGHCLVIEDLDTCDYFLKEVFNKKTLYESDKVLLYKLQQKVASLLSLCSPDVVLENLLAWNFLTTYLPETSFTKFFSRCSDKRSLLDALSKYKINRSHLVDFVKHLIDEIANASITFLEESYDHVEKLVENFLIYRSDEEFVQSLEKLKELPFYPSLLNNLLNRQESIPQKGLIYLFYRAAQGQRVLPKLIDHFEKEPDITLSEWKRYFEPFEGTVLFFRFACVVSWDSLELIAYLFNESKNNNHLLPTDHYLTRKLKKKFLVHIASLPLEHSSAHPFFKEKEDFIDLLIACKEKEVVFPRGEELSQQLLKEVKSARYNGKQHAKKIELFCLYTPLFSLSIWIHIFEILETAPVDLKEKVLEATFSKLTFNLLLPEMVKLTYALIPLLIESKRPYLYELSQKIDIQELYLVSQSGPRKPSLISFFQAIYPHLSSVEAIERVKSFVNECYEKDVCSNQILALFVKYKIVRSDLWYVQEAKKWGDKSLLKDIISKYCLSDNRELLAAMVNLLVLLPNNNDTIKFFKEIFVDLNAYHLFYEALKVNFWSLLAHEVFLEPYFDKALQTNYFRNSVLPDVKKFFESEQGVLCHINILESVVQSWVTQSSSEAGNKKIIEVIKRFTLPSLRPYGVLKLINLSDTIASKIDKIDDLEIALASTLESNRGNNNVYINELIKVLSNWSENNNFRLKGSFIRLIGLYVEHPEEKPNRQSLLYKTYKAIFAYLHTHSVTSADNRNFEDADLFLHYHQIILFTCLSGFIKQFRGSTHCEFTTKVARSPQEATETYRGKSGILSLKDSRYNELVLMAYYTKIDHEKLTQPDKVRYLHHITFLLEILLDEFLVDTPFHYELMDFFYITFAQTIKNIKWKPLLYLFDRFLHAPLRHEEIHEHHFTSCAKLYQIMVKEGYYVEDHGLLAEHCILLGRYVETSFIGYTIKEWIFALSFEKISNNLVKKIIEGSLGYESCFLSLIEIYGSFPKILSEHSSLKRKGPYHLVEVLSTHPHLIESKLYDAKVLVRITLTNYKIGGISNLEDVKNLYDLSPFIMGFLDCFDRGIEKMKKYNPVYNNLRMFFTRIKMGCYWNDYKLWVKDAYENIESTMTLIRSPTFENHSERKYLYFMLMHAICMVERDLIMYRYRLILSFYVSEFNLKDTKQPFENSPQFLQQIRDVEDLNESYPVPVPTPRQSAFCYLLDNLLMHPLPEEYEEDFLSFMMFMGEEGGNFISKSFLQLVITKLTLYGKEGCLNYKKLALFDHWPSMDMKKLMLLETPSLPESYDTFHPDIRPRPTFATLL